MTIPFKRPADRSIVSVAQELSLSTKTIRRMIYKGHFPNAYRTGNVGAAVWRIPDSDVQGFKTKRSKESQP